MSEHAPENEINRRDAILSALMLTGAGGVASLTEAFAQEIPGNSDLVAEIEAELRKQEEIWNSQDYQRIRELWDHDDPEPYFVAAELDETIIGWPALNKYLAPARSGLAAFRWGFSNVNGRLLAPTLHLPFSTIGSSFSSSARIKFRNPALTDCYLSFEENLMVGNKFSMQIVRIASRPMLAS